MDTNRIAASQTRAVAAAWVVVRRDVFERRRPADRALAEFLKKHPEFGGRDRRLIGDTIHGLLRWWGWLRAFVPEPVEPEAAAWARVLMAVGLFEEAQPPTATFWASQAGFDEHALAPWRDLPDAAARAVALFGGVPEAFTRTHLLPDWALPAIHCPRPISELIDWLQRRAPLWLRVQAEQIPLVLAELRTAELVAVAHPRVARALRLDPVRVNLQAVPAYREGRVEVQDISSQAVAAACSAQPGEHWLDVCAGAGGKTLALAREVGAAGRVLARDVRGDALAELDRRARRAGLNNIKTKIIDTEAEPGGEYDGVLVDAPCSGSGTWRRSPWARWQVAAENVPVYAARQLALLASAAGQVRGGGVLMYATCSMFAAENQDVVRQFLAAHGEFRPEAFENPLTGEPTEGQMQIWPWDADGDAMFVARLRRG